MGIYLCACRCRSETSRTTLRGYRLCRVLPCGLVSLPPLQRESGHRILLRIMPDTDICIPLFHRIHKRYTGTVRSRTADRYGTDTECTICDTRTILYVRRKMDEKTRS